MEIGIVGLGRMGAGMARRLARGGAHVVCYDQAAAARHALALSQQGLRYVDAGVSGGVHGLEHGYCLMLGGTPKSIEIFEPFARILAPGPERGWLHCGPSGAGHFAKMIHNGIEYGIMQSLAEGFALLAARPELDIDPARLAETWRHGSVVRSWLLDLCAEILTRGEDFARIAPVVADSGEGR